MVVERIEPYLSSEKLQARIAEVGKELSAVLSPTEPTIFICVLKGSFMFYADLLKHITVPTNAAFLAVSSYDGGTHSTGAVRLTHDLTLDIANQDVVLVEDIVDTGLTMSYLLEVLRARKPRSLRVCSLLHKPARERIKVPIDHCGFVIDDVFVVGYGLDYEQRYRDLPFIGVMHFDGPSAT
ncbi:MAG: hypoxanthine phosphoribosyltransferase [Myxococcales bacterium]|nr:hypoxanthine phosphoribosyltransferase [Myxococcales bacterium]